jgi:hypothetical protein
MSKQIKFSNGTTNRKTRKNRSDIPFKPADKKMKPVHRPQVDKNFEIC